MVGDGLMHASVMEWLRRVRAEMGDISEWEVLEVGSCDENGSPREVFAGAESYWGVDAREGRGVDQVMISTRLQFPDNHFDLIVSTEMLEHDRRPWRTLVEMARVLHPGGHLLLTARGFDAYGGYPEHPCPNDYWRFNRSSFTLLIEDAGLQIVELAMDPGQEAPGVFGRAVKS